MELQSISWHNGAIRIIDQTFLPERLKFLVIRDIRTLWEAIKLLRVRGAPAIGAAGALGVYLGVKDFNARTSAQLLKKIDSVGAYLGSSRPTARNLFWGIEKMQKTAFEYRDAGPQAVKQALFNCAQEIIEDDRRVCRQIGRFGQELIKKNASVLTVCNAGMLATIDYGTALGVLYSARAKGKRFSVYACETRPLLQGARLTAWELLSNGIAVTLICDNMAATLMQQGKVDIVIAGADRITAGGDVANKIGTYNLAVLCAYHKIPFYIAAPVSTFDLSLVHGKDIPIEQRSSEEITHLFFKKSIAPKGVRTYNPAFDVTGHSLITGIITELGVIRPPFARNIAKVIGKK